QRPADLRGVPVLDHRIDLAAHVLDGLADQGKQRLKPRVHRFHWHPTTIPAPARHDGEPPPPSCGGSPSVRGGSCPRPNQSEIVCPDPAGFPAVTRHSAPHPSPRGRGRNTPLRRSWREGP